MHVINRHSMVHGNFLNVCQDVGVNSWPKHGRMESWTSKECKSVHGLLFGEYFWGHKGYYYTPTLRQDTMEETLKIVLMAKNLQ